jgi:GGDEF domain-containing protein
VTISAGVAVGNLESEANIDELLRLADVALYRAKRDVQRARESTINVNCAELEHHSTNPIVLSSQVMGKMRQSER